MLNVKMHDMKMFNAEQMNEWRDKSHGLAIEKGWYDEERAKSSLIMLINSEVFEAYECWRNKADETYFDENRKPCGLPSEIADIVIRLFDMSGFYNIDFPNDIFFEKEFMWWIDHKDFEEFCRYIAEFMFDFIENSYEDYIEVISYIFYYCQKNNIDLEKEMTIKYEYNKTRSKRHGGKRS